MKIGIDASRAFLKNRTGIEEYSYQIIKVLLGELKDHEVVLYVKKNQPASLTDKELRIKNQEYNAVEIREIGFSRFWTQIGLSLELLINPVDVLFIPAHTVPFVHPKNTVVTVHGLEYEHCPESYSFYSRLLHRFFIKKSCFWAKKIIAVSRKTKKDLVRMYRVPKRKVDVIYNGYDKLEPRIEDYESRRNRNDFRYILFIGRLETRKNIGGVIEAFEVLKEKHGYKGKLILAGRPGYGYSGLKFKIQNSKFKKAIVEKGFVEDEKKWQLMRDSDVFLFPSFCEGFGIPILEAQSAGVPVVTSDYGPMDEVAGDESVLINPRNSKMMAELTNRLIKDKVFRQGVINGGLENVKRFSWEKSGREVGEVLKSF